MGRHSARPRNNAARTRRLVKNSLAVAIATLATMLVVFVGLTAFAAAENSKVPMPTMAVDESGAYVPIPQEHADSGPIPEPTIIDGVDTSGGAPMRVCPATGCSAPTCHAETGEPIPGR
jgi:hypothetical protein